VTLGKKYTTRGERRRKLFAATAVFGGVLLSISTTTAVSGDLSHRQEAMAAAERPDAAAASPVAAASAPAAKQAASSKPASAASSRQLTSKPTVVSTKASKTLKASDSAEVCSAELRHPTASVASALRVGTPTRQQLCADDNDAWSTIFLQSGLSYMIETFNLSTGADTELTLFAPDGARVLASDDDSGPTAGASRLQITASTSGTYLITVRRAKTTVSSQPIRFDVRVQ
jgi:hypothetical protein